MIGLSLYLPIDTLMNLLLVLRFILLPSLFSTLERFIFLSIVFIITKHQKVAVSQILRKVKERQSTF